MRTVRAYSNPYCMVFFVFNTYLHSKPCPPPTSMKNNLLYLCRFTLRFTTNIYTTIAEACQLSWICHETHNFNFKLKISQAVPLIPRFLATLANSQVFSMEIFMVLTMLRKVSRCYLTVFELVFELA